MNENRRCSVNLDKKSEEMVSLRAQLVDLSKDLVVASWQATTEIR